MVLDRREFPSVITTLHNYINFTYRLPDSFLNVTYLDRKCVKALKMCDSTHGLPLTLYLQRVRNIKVQEKSKISFRKKQNK